MDCTKYLNSYEEVKKLVSEIQSRRIPVTVGLAEPFQEYFRGQASNRYLLVPSLCRNKSDIETIQKIEKEIIQEFKNEIDSKGLSKEFLMNPLTSGEFKDNWYLLFQAQHCHLPTRLMEWALKWEVALFFAVEDSVKNNEEDGQFWVYSPMQSSILNDLRKKEYLDVNPLEFKNQNLINPPFFWTENYDREVGEVRRARQHGKFFIQSIANSKIPMEDQEHLLPYLEKYCISKEAKAEIRNHLYEEGFKKDFIYPKINPEIELVVSGLKKKDGI